MTGTITFDWPSVVIAGLALIVSILAFVQAVRHRVLDRSLTVHQTHVRLSLDLERFQVDADVLKNEWRAVLNVLGSAKSGAMIHRENQLNAVSSVARTLADDLAKIDTSPAWIWQGGKVENSLRSLSTIRARADDLQAELSSSRADLLRAKDRIPLGPR